MSNNPAVEFLSRTILESGSDASLDPDTLLARAREEGLDVTQEQLGDAAVALATAVMEAGELSDDDLDGVAGGAGMAGGMSQGLAGAAGGMGMAAGGQQQAMMAQQSGANLQLQQSLQKQNRNFQMLSNVLKARHDAAMRAIRNLK